MTNSESWITLLEYSTKYDVSISTLRRKIKANRIDYDMDNGKYYVPDRDIKEALRQERNKKLGARHSPSALRKEEKKSASVTKKKNFNPAPIQKEKMEAIKKEIPEVKISEQRANSNEAVFSTANRLLDELKKAYTFVLQEKESQIIHLRSELSDLKTLVRVLEDEVLKLRSK